jgi:hypothetical protein
MKTEIERHGDGREEEGGGRGAESYDRKKAWSSMNHSILSDLSYFTSFSIVSIIVF